MATVVEEKEKNREELLWNADLIQAIKPRIQDEFPNIKIIKGKVLKDIFFSTGKRNPALQFGFVDQDIGFYDGNDSLDVSVLKNSKSFFLHKNNPVDNHSIIVPKIICELKFNGSNSHGLITYSNYAEDIKAIFPGCRYYLVLRYKGNSSIDKFFRHGKHFDRIISFDDSKRTEKYTSQKFLKELLNDSELKIRFNEFINEVKFDLRKKTTGFIK